MTPEDKQKQLHLTLDEKIKRSKELILEWYLQYQGKVYVSFSGGKDSTVLLHLARNIKYCENIPAVFCDTGLEYPEVREHVKSVDNVIWIKPKLTFKQVIEKYGWPIVSKEQARYIYDLRHSKSDKVKNTRLNGVKNGRTGKISQCWRPLVNAGFEITNKCCKVMKKDPFKFFEKETGLHPIIGTMAVESRRRFKQYLRGNCNAFSAKHPISKPLSFWTEQDILEYIKRYNVKIPSVYGDIKSDENGVLRTTKCTRTGCMFCMFGLHLESHPNRFEQMKESHPKQYDYIMNKLEGKHIMNFYLACSRRKI